MDFKVNGWVILGLAVILALSYGFSYVNMRMAVPAVAAQIGSNQELVKQVNAAFETQNKAIDDRLVQIETKVDTIQKMK